MKEREKSKLNFDKIFGKKNLFTLFGLPKLNFNQFVLDKYENYDFFYNSQILIP